MSTTSQFLNQQNNLREKKVSAPYQNDDVNKSVPSHKKLSLSNDDDAGYIPISCLNTFTQDWAIKARVCRKYPVKHWNNARGQGSLFKIDLVDRGDCQIEATFFGDAQAMSDKIEEGRVYTMSGGQVKMANKKFTTIKNDYCITFGDQAIIELKQDGDDGKKIKVG